jgi:hypothetical protein
MVERTVVKELKHGSHLNNWQSNRSPPTLNCMVGKFWITIYRNAAGLGNG